eukprot:GEZU01009769.1.p1 GENE.GEZU01009769.1~~GEZU01009769.1.p1  ORF type:complete len:328 (+),score=55.91 GEZU01009769.1:375-1358(+)
MKQILAVIHFVLVYENPLETTDEIQRFAEMVDEITRNFEKTIQPNLRAWAAQFGTSENGANELRSQVENRCASWRQKQNITDRKKEVIAMVKSSIIEQRAVAATIPGLNPDEVLNYLASIDVKVAKQFHRRVLLEHFKPKGSRTSKLTNGDLSIVESYNRKHQAPPRRLLLSDDGACDYKEDHFFKDSERWAKAWKDWETDQHVQSALKIAEASHKEALRKTSLKRTDPYTIYYFVMRTSDKQSLGYIGSTKNAKIRWQNHISDANSIIENTNKKPQYVDVMIARHGCKMETAILFIIDQASDETKLRKLERFSANTKCVCGGRGLR